MAREVGTVLLHYTPAWYDGSVEMAFSTVHKQFPAAAEYLGGIYIIQREYGVVPNGKLAEWVGVSGSAVTQALGRLKKLGLVRQKRYGHIELTEEGKSFAIKVLRRHYLLEHLLVGLLDYPWDKADREAKLLQGVISDDLTSHIDDRLGKPQVCPHGNPMPGSEVERSRLDAPRLADGEEGQVVRILRITEEGENYSSLLKLCYRHGIRPGARFSIEKRAKKSIKLLSASPPIESIKPVRIPLEMAVYIRCESSAPAEG